MKTFLKALWLCLSGKEPQALSRLAFPSHWEWIDAQLKRLEQDKRDYENSKR